MGRETWLSMSFEASTFRMIEATRLFLLDQVSEDADVFGLQNLNREDFRRVTSKNKAVEGEKLRGIGSCDRLSAWKSSLKTAKKPRLNRTQTAQDRKFPGPSKTATAVRSSVSHDF